MSAQFLERKPLLLCVMQCTIEEAGPSDPHRLVEGYSVPGYTISENADWEKPEYRERVARELAAHILEHGYDTLFMVAHKGSLFVERELHILDVLLEELGEDAMEVIVLTQDWQEYRPTRQVRAFLRKEWWKNLFKRVFRRGNIRFASVSTRRLSALKPWLTSMLEGKGGQRSCFFGSYVRNP